MLSILTWLNGKKTYFLAGAGLIVVNLYFYGTLDEATAEMILAALGFGSIATMRSAMKRLIDEGKNSSVEPTTPVK